MKPLFTEEEYQKAKTIDRLPCECYNCGNEFFTQKRHIYQVLNGKRPNTVRFCNKECSNKGMSLKQRVICKNCNKEFTKYNCHAIASPNHFCTKSCAATYNNKNKTHGYRRSKIEVWLEEQLYIFYPKLEFHFNRKDTIGSELDIYIPSLKLAFELNGIFHYEPIYGENTLTKIQNNDQNKFKACIEKEISLCIIDSSSLKYFKPDNVKKYLDIVTKIINEKLDAES